MSGPSAAAVVDEPINDMTHRPPADDIEIHHNIGRLSKLMSMLSCCKRSAIGNSVHFHADHVEDVSIVYFMLLCVCVVDRRFGIRHPSSCVRGCHFVAICVRSHALN